MQNENFFSIAELDIKICFAESPFNGMHLIPSLEPFREKNLKGELFFQLSVDDTLSPYPKEKRKRIRAFDTGNGNTIVDKLDNGGYQYIIKDIQGANCCLLLTNKDFSDCQCALNGNYNMRKFGLNNALMLIFAFAGSKIETLLLHASLVRQNGYGYAFIAKSGTGKSTHSGLWLKHIPGCELLNDDNPIVHFNQETEEATVYGSPWSGKTPCYKNDSVPVGAFVRLEQAPVNEIQRESPARAFASLLPSCSNLKEVRELNNGVIETVKYLAAHTPVYFLKCLPDKEAAEVCFNTIKQQATS